MSGWPSDRIFSIGLGWAPPAWPVAALLPDIGDVQERGALEPDFDERRLHPRQHARNLADKDVADQGRATARARGEAPALRPLATTATRVSLPA